MAMLKTVGWGHKKPGKSSGDGTKDGRGRSNEELQDYLAFGDDVTKSQIKDYLEHGHGAIESRVRAFRSSPGLVAADENNWAARMQATRMRYGKDSKRTYGHFIVSPDPEDKVSAEECADVADEWAEAMFPGFEHVVVVHDDNKNGITHAHVVVNTVHPKTGYKIQVSDGDIYRQWDKLQKICEEHGLRDLPQFKEWRQRLEESEQRAKTEAWERAAGSRSWKEQIRGAVDRSAEAASSWEDFLERLASTGVTVTRESAKRGRGLVFHHPEGGEHAMRVRAAKLGAEYTEDALRARLGVDFDTMWHKAPERDAYAPPAARALRERHNVHAPGSPWAPADRTMEDWALQRRALNPRLRRIDGVLDAVAELSAAGITHHGALMRRVRILEEDVARAEEEADGMRSAADRALAIAEAARGRDEASARLAELGAAASGRLFSSPAERRERKALEERVEELSARVDAGLKAGSAYIAHAGLESATDEEKALALLRLCRGMSRALGKELEQARAELEAVQSARRTYESTYVMLYGPATHGKISFGKDGGARVDAPGAGPRERNLHRIDHRPKVASKPPKTPEQRAAARAAMQRIEAERERSRKAGDHRYHTPPRASQARLLATLIEQKVIGERDLAELSRDPAGLSAFLTSSRGLPDRRLVGAVKARGDGLTMGGVDDFLYARHGAISKARLDPLERVDMACACSGRGGPPMFADAPAPRARDAEEHLARERDEFIEVYRKRFLSDPVGEDRRPPRPVRVPIPVPPDHGAKKK